MIEKAQVLKALKQVVDPEMGINILDLGLFCGIETAEEGVQVEFTLTYPGCPIGPELQRAIPRVLQEKTTDGRAGQAGERSAGSEGVLRWRDSWRGRMPRRSAFWPIAS